VSNIGRIIYSICPLLLYIKTSVTDTTLAVVWRLLGVWAPAAAAAPTVGAGLLWITGYYFN
jgi:hypothetical protein